MKKLIALAALVLVSMVTTNRVCTRRVARNAVQIVKAQRDAERARLKAEQQAADAVSYDDAVAALKAQKFVLEANQVMFPQRTNGFRHLQHEFRIGESGTRYGTGGFQHCLSRS